MDIKTTEQPVEDEQEVDFTELPSEENAQTEGGSDYHSAVMHGTDWTTETIVSQMRRGNIELNPSFQRRDAWDIAKKSKFIESLILGIPIPQLVLAESEKNRGKFIVLDGKQRLLSILQFWGIGEGNKNAYALSGLEVLEALNNYRYTDLESSIDHQESLDSLQNQSIRTVVIRNWPNIDFLHTVFLRLNTGSVRLSPQELRQALFPGPFSTWIDEASSNSIGISHLLNLKEPDYRMRDIEILARFLSFHFYMDGYNGRMRNFIDTMFKTINANWSDMQSEVRTALKDLEAAIQTLTMVFEHNTIARRPNSKPFNRAIFDFLAFYAQRPDVREKMLSNPLAVRNAYKELFLDADFRAAVERTTSGVPSTAMRFSMWGLKLNSLFGLRLPLPYQDPKNILRFPGFKQSRG